MLSKEIEKRIKILKEEETPANVGNVTYAERETLQRFLPKIKELEGNLWTYKKCYENSKKQFVELAKVKEKEIKALEKENKRLKEELK